MLDFSALFDRVAGRGVLRCCEAYSLAVMDSAVLMHYRLVLLCAAARREGMGNAVFKVMYRTDQRKDNEGIRHVQGCSCPVGNREQYTRARRREADIAIRLGKQDWIHMCTFRYTYRHAGHSQTLTPHHPTASIIVALASIPERHPSGRHNQSGHTNASASTPQPKDFGSLVLTAVRQI